MSNLDGLSMTYAPDLSTLSGVPNTVGICTSSRSDGCRKQEHDSLSQRVSALEAMAVHDMNRSIALHQSLGLLVDFQSRTISVDETVGIHRKVTDLQDQLNDLRAMIMKLHTKIEPLLMIVDDRNAVLAELQKDIDILRARKEKLAEEISELNLLL